MRAIPLLIALISTATLAQSPPPNPRIDPHGFLSVTTHAMKHRENRRLSETDFLRMSKEPDAVVLDARSAEKFREMHIEGAVNLSFPDITAESLARLAPDKSTRILIYCNNNFTGATRAFPIKLPTASLNLSTFTALYDYGYRNVYELGPNVDVKKTIGEGMNSD
jgi:hypothetical protein